MDHGLFGPGSVTWRVMGEPVLVVGGFRALLMQGLHPRAMRGVLQNSSLMDLGSSPSGPACTSCPRRPTRCGCRSRRPCRCI
jgi:uncharacterized protein (DUF2236 family)